jgi:hypothetical protein
MESNYVDVIPNHDFIGVFFVSSIDETTLYAVVPRFWHTKITDELRSFNGINLRILTQNILKIPYQMTRTRSQFLNEELVIMRKLKF